MNDAMMKKTGLDPKYACIRILMNSGSQTIVGSDLQMYCLLLN